MLKKAGTVVAVMAGLMMVGAPAFAVAGEPHEHGDGYSPGEGHGHGHSEDGHWQAWVEPDDEGGEVHQFGLINFADDSDVLSNINICNVEVNVLTVPILSNNDQAVCINTDNDGG
ncbi:hypothetical protein [Saccharothrix stipae]